MFGHGLNPDYFINPPAYTYVLHALFTRALGDRPGDDRRRVRGRPDDGVRARPRRLGRSSARSPSRCWRSPARGCSRTSASARSRARCSRSRSCRSTTRTSRSTTCRRWRRWRAALVGDRRHLPDRPHARVRARRASALGVAIATKYQAGIVLVTLVAAAFASPVVHARVRNLALALGLLCRGLRGRQPVRAARPPGVPRGAREADRDRGRGGRQARPREHARAGATTSGRSPGASAGCRRCSRSAVPSRWSRASAGWRSCSRPRRCCCSSTSASRRASSRAGCCRSTRSCACSRPTARSRSSTACACARALALGALSVLLLAPGARLQRPQRPRAGARRHALGGARVDEGRTSRPATNIVVEPIAPDQWAMDAGRPLFEARAGPAAATAGTSGARRARASSTAAADHSGTCPRGQARGLRAHDAARRSSTPTRRAASAGW